MRFRSTSRPLLGDAVAHPFNRVARASRGLRRVPGTFSRPRSVKRGLGKGVGRSRFFGTVDDSRDHFPQGNEELVDTREPIAADPFTPMQVLDIAAPPGTQVDELRWFLADAHNKGVCEQPTALGRLVGTVRRLAASVPSIEFAHPESPKKIRNMVVADGSFQAYVSKASATRLKIV